MSKTREEQIQEMVQVLKDNGVGQKRMFRPADRVRFAMPILDTDTGDKIDEGQISKIDGGYVYLYVTLSSGIIQIERYPNELTLI